MAKSGITPLEPDVPWWRKVQAGFDVELRLGPGPMALREYLLNWEGDFVRQYKGYRCFWLRGILTVLGLSIGAAIFVRGGKVE